VLSTSRIRRLCEEDVTELLRLGPIRFVVADVGRQLHWINLADSCSFWKDEAKPHLANTPSRIQLDSFPNSYAYIASQWSSGDSVPIVALEWIH
jgi:hypothetical protein